MSKYCNGLNHEQCSSKVLKLKNELKEINEQLKGYKQEREILLSTNPLFVNALHSLVNNAQINSDIIYELSEASLAGNQYASYMGDCLFENFFTSLL